MATLFLQFATPELPKHFEVSKGQQIDLMQRGLEYFKERVQLYQHYYKVYFDEES
jgi:hypothetical protein